MICLTFPEEWDKKTAAQGRKIKVKVKLKVTYDQHVS